MQNRTTQLVAAIRADFPGTVVHTQSHSGPIQNTSDNILCFLREVFSVAAKMVAAMLEVSARPDSGLRGEQRPGADAKHNTGQEYRQAGRL